MICCQTAYIVLTRRTCFTSVIDLTGILTFILSIKGLQQSPHQKRKVVLQIILKLQRLPEGNLMLKLRRLPEGNPMLKLLILPEGNLMLKLQRLPEGNLQGTRILLKRLMSVTMQKHHKQGKHQQKERVSEV